MTTLRVTALIAGIFLAAWLPVSAAALPSAPPVSSQVHIVRAGDTLWAIARQHGLTPAQLSKANGLEDAGRLRVGTRIVVPAPGSSPESLNPTTPIRPRRPGMIWPSRGVVTSRFGLRGKRHHHGIDIAAPVGSPIRSTRDGVVQFAGWQGGYGRLVILDHGDGLTTWYGHASRILVRVGQRISKGEVIALVGTSGQVTGPNLHFEVRRNSVPLDPWPFLTGRSI